MKETRERYFQKVEMKNLVRDFEPWVKNCLQIC